MPASSHPGLAEAQRLREVVSARAGWYRGYLLIYGLTSIAVVLLVGLVGGPVGVAVAMGLWATMLALLSSWAAREPVRGRGFSGLHRTVIAGWALLYGVVLVVGLVWFAGQPAWWVPGAVAVALPALVGAWRLGRRA